MTKKLAIIFGVLALSSIVVYAFVSYGKSKDVSSFASFPFESVSSSIAEEPNLELEKIEEKKIHILKPENVKGAYMSSWVAGTSSIRSRLTNLVNTTELNSLVIDFKDSTGVISIPAGDNASQDRINAASKRAADLPKYLEELHSHNIYTIARISVFEDPIYAKHNPSFAVQNSKGNVWADKHGLSWVDPGYKEFHQYILDLALEAHSIGFDEINFDYIRFPTDGSRDKVYPVTKDANQQLAITNFIKFIHDELKSRDIPMSIDVFGQIVSTKDDMGIGQYYEDLLSNTDAIAPMVYPSHFYPGYKNIKSPESSPYETIKLSLTDAVNRKNAIISNTEIRPWIQDFSLAVPYDAKMVRAQINAAKDLGINSFLLWDPKNRYTKDALNLEQTN